MNGKDLSPVPFGEFNIATNDILPAHSDKSILPASILSTLLDLPRFSNDNLPHPLIFKVTNHHNGNFVYVGVKEFTSPQEQTLILPKHIITKLDNTNDDTTVSIELVTHIPKSTFLTLKPLQFYPEITSWKYYLESKLPTLYTTLSKNEHLIIDNKYELLVEDTNDTTVCIVDTDTILDVIPLNDIMANQQLEYDKNLNYLNNIQELDVQNNLIIRDLKSMKNSIVPQIYKLDITKFQSQNITLTLGVADGNSNEFEKDDYSSLFNIDLVVGLDKLVNLENFNYTTIDQDFKLQYNLHNFETTQAKKRVVIDLKDDNIVNKIHKGLDNDNDDENNEKYIYFIPFSWDFTTSVSIIVYDGIEDEESEKESNLKEIQIEENTLECTNCSKAISKNKFQLHQAFCLRNNKRCSCGLIFLKEIPSNHWHCELCNDDKIYGSSSLLKFKHDKLIHSPPYKCNKCDDDIEYEDFISLIKNHQSTKCPAKLHECKFCHLILPQEQSTFEDNFVNLTHHENGCGNKTTECYKCNKVLRIKDLSKHMKMHNLNKINFNQFTQSTFNKCSNENCITLIDIYKSSTNSMGLCDFCFGPLYISQIDPNNMKLQIRIERKYMIQLSKGCGFDWCSNIECLNGNKSSASKPKNIKEILSHINNTLFSQIHNPLLPINEKNGNTKFGDNKFWFCVNESINNKKKLIDKLLFEQQYNESIIYKAVNEVKGSEEQDVRSWLEENGV